MTLKLNSFMDNTCKSTTKLIRHIFPVINLGCVLVRKPEDIYILQGRSWGCCRPQKPKIFFKKIKRNGGFSFKVRFLSVFLLLDRTP